MLWLFSNDNYTFNATPPEESGLSQAALAGVTITSDTTVTIQLDETITLSGKVLDPTGAPIADQRMLLYPIPGSSIQTFTDEQGNYSYEVAPGDFDMVLSRSLNSIPPNSPQTFHIATEPPFTLTESNVLDFVLPTKQVVVHVQDPAGNPVQGVEVKTNTPSSTALELLGQPASGYSGYLRPVVTDANGDALLWLFPNDNYDFNITPPIGSEFVGLNLSDVQIVDSKTIIVVLDFSHIPPSTQAILSPPPNSANEYSNPTTITLTSTPAIGYSVVSTYYMLDSGIEQQYIDPIIVGEGGTHTITFWSVDNSGVFEIPNTITFEIVNDTDEDGIPDDQDNAPNHYNPDQSDIDGDGIGDVADPCPNDASDSCDPDGSAATYVIADDGGTLETDDGSVSIIFPPGAMDEDSSVSITDTDDGSSGFELTSNRGKVLGVFSVDLQPSQSFDPPLIITFSWDDEDSDGVIDGTNIHERNLIVTKDNVVNAGKCEFEPADDGILPDCDMVANSYTFEVSNWSEFALAYANDPVVTSITTPVEPVSIDNLPIIIGSFTDADDDDSHTAIWDWGNEIISIGGVDQENNSVSRSPSYTESGVYVIELAVTDQFPNSGSLTSPFLVVYDPDGGFVTGGGWFSSPSGAYVADPSLTGKATFGFVSKYKKGATVPTGNTEFRFKAGDFSFHSSNYDWLVVTGSDYARFKGAGTINGEGVYKFMIWAGDGELDTFRIKIWEEVDGVETVIYDNGMDQPIDGGNIRVHTD